ncbi:amidohydrolase [Leekyejoonella antrihumi]|uniref:Amidohydrolase n=1 Tax=Leekyejoonella antrihumi TaxID=1660198 RepID=A0A563DVQ3_9MICO|nr:amidohydrolase [Leekyejoonella antrihumi]TWP33804.1 amidohydrolase [Leekyejoonella antrihumi]
MPLSESMRADLTALQPELSARYRDLHAHPELSMQETRTAGIVGDQLREQGWEVTEHVGVTGVVGVLRHGDGPTVLLRADMDGLPVKEDTGLAYASTAMGLDADGTEQPVMHACGHDTHITCLLGVTALLARHLDAWNGTILAVFQPGEEIAAGAQAMLDDRFLERFGRPDVCLGQHVMPLPAGHVAIRSGTAMAASDSLRVQLFGRGGHGSTPEATVDPVVMAAATIMRLQTVVSRVVAPNESAVLTVGSVHAGTKENIIPAQAELKLNIRSFTEGTRTKVLHAIDRIVGAEATASGAPEPPRITTLNRFPVTVNDEAATRSVQAALSQELGEEHVHEVPPLSGSEDFGTFGTTAGVPSVFWFWGGHDPAQEARFAPLIASGTLPDGVPGNHSPQFAPVIDPTLQVGVRCLLSAALAWIGIDQPNQP